jgi:hypothetical protein
MSIADLFKSAASAGTSAGGRGLFYSSKAQPSGSSPRRESIGAGPGASSTTRRSTAPTAEQRALEDWINHVPPRE